jgi:CheY-like chemotaxis protein
MSSYALIADPDVAAALVYACAARDEGMTYISVRDGTRALAVLAERGTPALLVTEIVLPDMDGLTLVERIRRAPSGEATAVLVVSADLDARDRASRTRSRLDLGAVLSKAASVESIRRVLRRLQVRAVPTPPRARPTTDAPPPPSSPVPGPRASEVRTRGRAPGRVRGEG